MVHIFSILIFFCPKRKKQTKNNKILYRNLLLSFVLNNTRVKRFQICLEISTQRFDLSQVESPHSSHLHLHLHFSHIKYKIDHLDPKTNIVRPTTTTTTTTTTTKAKSHVTSRQTRVMHRYVYAVMQSARLLRKTIARSSSSSEIANK